jgi:hypothetical protein
LNKEKKSFNNTRKEESREEEGKRSQEVEGTPLLIIMTRVYVRGN